jgi:hypothetical protein
MPEPEHGAIDEQSSRSSKPKSDRRSVSVIGLSIVSALNIACLAFVIFHFVGHEGGGSLSPAGDRMATTDPVSPMPLRPIAATVSGAHDRQAIESIRALGNIEFARTSRLAIAIASGVDETPLPASSQPSRGTPQLSKAQPGATHELHAKNDVPGHWVQLGALSKEATAHSYWSHLRKKHKTLLDGQTPQYFGPDAVGGSLYHIRLGPMTAGEAEGLCKKLLSDGADCYCVRPSAKKAS